MKISELIAGLQKMQAEYGDRKVNIAIFDKHGNGIDNGSCEDVIPPSEESDLPEPAIELMCETF